MEVFCRRRDRVGSFHLFTWRLSTLLLLLAVSLLQCIVFVSGQSYPRINYDIGPILSVERYDGEFHKLCVDELTGRRSVVCVLVGWCVRLCVV